MRLPLPDEAATQALGAALADVLRPGDVVGLQGTLGAGKSTLARACLHRLAGAPIEVPSPTFTLVQIYDFAALTVWHVDLYRLEPPADVAELGLEDALDDAALMIEWPERLAEGAFPDRLAIELAWADEGDATARAARLVGGAPWRDRLNALTAATPR